MSMLDKAMIVAREALKGINDQNGEPYINHSIRIMDKMDTEDEKVVALLHDVMEDSETTIHDLEYVGFGREVLEAVEQLTKRKDMTYDEYIEDISCSDLARKIKLAEIDDNLDVFRVNKMSFKTYSLEERAKRSKAVLERE